MATIESLTVFSDAIRASAAALVGSSLNAEADRKALAAQWNSRVEKLTEWERGPKAQDEDGLLAPTQQAIAAAFQVAVKLRDAGVPAPLRMVQDGAGGIVFEWKQGDASDKLRLDQDGYAEATGFRDSKLAYRRPISCN